MEKHRTIQRGYMTAGEIAGKIDIILIGGVK